MPRDEALEGGECRHAFPDEGGGSPYARADAEEVLRGLLRASYPSAVAGIALALRHSGIRAFSVETADGVVLEVPAQAMRKLVREDLARRFAKAADGKGGGT